MPQPPPPPHQPPKLNHHNPNPTIHTHFPRPTSLPDFLLTAVSLLLLITAPKHHLSHRSPPFSLSYTTHPRISRLTSTTMSHNRRNPKNPTSFPFLTPQSLSDWLKPRLPSDSFSTWGTLPGTKNVHNLWLELLDGETSLVDTTPPVRNLEVVCVRISRRNNYGGEEMLVESHQELSDGSTRKRDRMLSEKMKAGEDIEAATRRAVREELGSVISDLDFDQVVKVVMDTYERKVEERSSVSYPGLPACYVLHCVVAVVDGLPEGEFVTEEGEEYGEEGGDHGVASAAVKVKRHFWKWVPADSV